MVAAVADVDFATRCHMNSMRAIEATLARVAIWAITRFSISDQGFDFSCPLMNDPDDVVFCVTDQNIAVVIHGNSLGARKLSQFGIPLITGKAGLTRAGHVMHRLQ